MAYFVNEKYIRMSYILLIGYICISIYRDNWLKRPSLVCSHAFTKYFTHSSSFLHIPVHCLIMRAYLFYLCETGRRSEIPMYQFSDDQFDLLQQEGRSIRGEAIKWRRGSLLIIIEAFYWLLSSSSSFP